MTIYGAVLLKIHGEAEASRAGADSMVKHVGEESNQLGKIQIDREAREPAHQSLRGERTFPHENHISSRVMIRPPMNLRMGNLQQEIHP